MNMFLTFRNLALRWSDCSYKLASSLKILDRNITDLGMNPAFIL
jgi:hypothetical protein